MEEVEVNPSSAEIEALELAAKYVLAFVCHRIDKAENPGDDTMQQSMAQAADDLIEDQIASFKRLDVPEELKQRQPAELKDLLYQTLQQNCKGVSPEVVTGYFEVIGEKQEGSDTVRPRLMFVADAWIRDWERAMQEEYEAYMRAECEPDCRAERMRAIWEAEIRADVYGEDF